MTNRRTASSVPSFSLIGEYLLESMLIEYFASASSTASSVTIGSSGLAPAAEESPAGGDSPGGDAPGGSAGDVIEPPPTFSELRRDVLISSASAANSSKSS